MPNETENNPIIPPTVDDGIKPKASRKPKPLIEGINTPSIKSVEGERRPDWTEAEKKLMNETSVPVQSSAPVSKPININKIDDSKLMPRQVAEKTGGKGKSFAKSLVSFIILVFVGFGGYQFYNWYMGRPSGLEGQQVTELLPTPTIVENLTPTPTPTAVPTAVSAPQTTLKIKSTPTGYLNVRSEPATTATQVTRVNPGETFVYTEVKNGWYKITLDAAGKTGWVIGTYIEKQ